MLIKSALRDLLFCIIRYDRNSADWLAGLASPYPASPDCPRKRGQNKTPRNILFISISTVSTGCCAPSKRWQGNWIHRGAPRPANPVTCFPPGKVVAPATKGGMHFRHPQGGCKGFIIRGRHLSIKRRPPPPFEPSEPFEPERRRRLNPQARQGLSIRRVNLREYWKAPPRSRIPIPHSPSLIHSYRKIP